MKCDLLILEIEVVIRCFRSRPTLRCGASPTCHTERSEFCERSRMYLSDSFSFPAKEQLFPIGIYNGSTTHGPESPCIQSDEDCTIRDVIGTMQSM